MGWAQVLSGGEQQRLALGRALLLKPTWLFLDEATSAMDPTMELRQYQNLQANLTQCTFISIAHRQALKQFHRQQWVIQDGRIVHESIQAS